MGKRAMRVLLVMPPIDTCYEYVMPIGLMNLFLIGKELGCEMELMNLSAYSYESALEKILSKECDLIGISCNFTNAAPSCMRYARDIKNKYPRTLIISGGNHATLAPEDLLFNEYDYVLYGEAEGSYREFMLRLLQGRSVRDLKGICYVMDGTISKNPPYEPIQDLDTLPFNDFRKFNLEPYFEWAGLRYINIETSRGCIYNCSFCGTVRMWGHQYRHKSAARIVDEFKAARRLGCEFVFLCDDDSAIDEEQLRNFCALLIKESIDIPWGTTIGCHSVRKQSTLDLMARSGCIKVNICVESANARILKEYRKPYTIDDNSEMCSNLRKRGILVHNHGIIGFANETVRESLNTYLYLIATSPMWHVSILEPRPGSDYWEQWDRKGDPASYKHFGKANVILSKKRLRNYVMYRLFALLYFLSPIRIWKAFFHETKAIRYSYRIQYYVAYRTIRANSQIRLEGCKKSIANLFGLR
jgi:anaerobic magnesium-protoporphyrin IX monomethyl ester cyclase